MTHDEELIAELRLLAAEATTDRDAWKAKAERYMGALIHIAGTLPTNLCLDLCAKVSDPDYVKLRNNHMNIARAALED